MDIPSHRIHRRVHQIHPTRLQRRLRGEQRLWQREVIIEQTFCLKSIHKEFKHKRKSNNKKRITY